MKQGAIGAEFSLCVYHANPGVSLNHRSDPDTNNIWPIISWNGQLGLLFIFLTLKALGFFLPVQHWCGMFSNPHPPPPPPLCKIRSRHSRKLKLTGLLAYIMIYKICRFESSTIINDVITKTMAKFGVLR